MREHKPFELKDFLTVKQGQLFIGELKAKELAQKYGTPLFVFSESRIRHNIAELQRISDFVDCGVKICYAAKANSNMAILQIIKRTNCDVEVNSGGELWKALKAGFSGEQIIFNGTSKEKWEIENAIEANIYAIQVDSIYELSLIEQVARRLNKKASVSLRIVPEIESDTHSGLRTALLTSKFGMMPEEAVSAFNTYANSQFLSLDGIHVHIGSQNPDMRSYSEALNFLVEYLMRIYKETKIKLKHLNIGGGFPVNYLRDKSQEKDFPPELQRMFSACFEPADAIAKAWETVKKNFGKAVNFLNDITLVIEPGRSIVADAGICLTTVRNKKERPLRLGKSNEKDVWLLTDAGFNILLSMETYKWYYQIVHAERTEEDHSYPYKIGGPLCDGGDVYFDIEGQRRLPDYRLLPANIQPGEILAILNCGAYSIAQMFQYNGRLLPCVVLLDERGKIRVIRHRDSFDDLIRNDVLYVFE